ARRSPVADDGGDDTGDGKGPAKDPQGDHGVLTGRSSAADPPRRSAAANAALLYGGRIAMGGALGSGRRGSGPSPAEGNGCRKTEQDGERQPCARDPQPNGGVVGLQLDGVATPWHR